MSGVTLTPERMQIVMEGTIAGKSLVEIGADLGMSHQSAHLIQKAIHPAIERARAAMDVSVEDIAKVCITEALDVIEESRAEGKPHTRLLASQSLDRAGNLMLKAQEAMERTAARDLASSTEFRAFVDAITTALAPHPDALAAVMAAIEGIMHG